MFELVRRPSHRKCKFDYEAKNSSNGTKNDMLPYKNHKTRVTE